MFASRKKHLLFSSLRPIVKNHAYIILSVLKPKRCDEPLQISFSWQIDVNVLTTRLKTHLLNVSNCIKYS